MGTKGTNSFNGSGNVASDVVYGKTKGGEQACNFKIAIEQAYKQLVYVRINVYGGFVEVCRRRKLKVGDYVVITGELMNREGKAETLTDVRCLEISIISNDNRRRRDGNRKEA